MKWKEKAASVANKQFEKHEGKHGVGEQLKKDFEKTGKILNLSLSDIEDNLKYQVRADKVKAEDYNKIRDSIKRDGQHTPILVTNTGAKPGKYLIISGFTRYQALKELRKPVLALYKAVDEATAFKIAWSENDDRTDLTFRDKLEHIKKLLAAGQKPQQIADDMFYSERMIKNFIYIGERKELLDLVEKGLNTKEAIKIVQKDEGEQKALIKQYKKIYENEDLSAHEKSKQKKELSSKSKKPYSINPARDKFSISLSGSLSKEKEKAVKVLEEFIRELKKA
jgi:ParB/RepB/Spo0J family partition protein